MPTVALWEKYHYWERLPIMFYNTPVVIPENIYRGEALHYTSVTNGCVKGYVSAV